MCSLTFPLFSVKSLLLSQNLNNNRSSNRNLPHLFF
jgi:hypothetical protein